MKVTKITSGLRRTKPVLSVLALAASACIATGQPVNTFIETFNGALDNPTGWITNNPANHFGIIGSAWVATDDYGNPGTELRRQPGGTQGSFDSHITVTLDPFRVAPSDTSQNTQTDFKWRFFGNDGFVEVVLNGFDDIRIYHNNSVAGVSGNLLPNTKVGYTDGDVLALGMSYDAVGDIIHFGYSLNAGPTVALYSGPGNGGSFGNFANSFTDFQLFKWGNTTLDQTYASVDEWDLVIPEPTSALLFGTGGLFLLIWRRRR